MISNWILSLALFGFFISWYIYRKKSRGEELICVIGRDCNRVVQSRYRALLFGIPNEVLGMVYYGFVAVVSVVILAGTATIGSFPILPILLVISGIAALFSILLLLIQAFVIREWCEYCIVSTVISTVIFLVELTTFFS